VSVLLPLWDTAPRAPRSTRGTAQITLIDNLTIDNGQRHARRHSRAVWPSTLKRNNVRLFEDTPPRRLFEERTRHATTPDTPAAVIVSYAKCHAPRHNAAAIRATPPHVHGRAGNAVYTAQRTRRRTKDGRTRETAGNATETRDNATPRATRRRTRPHGRIRTAGRHAPPLLFPCTPWTTDTHNGRAQRHEDGRHNVDGTTPPRAAMSETGRDNGTNHVLGRPAGGVSTRE